MAVSNVEDEDEFILGLFVFFVISSLGGFFTTVATGLDFLLYFLIYILILNLYWIFRFPVLSF